jgi:hypothetical protein
VVSVGSRTPVKGKLPYAEYLPNAPQRRPSAHFLNATLSTWVFPCFCPYATTRRRHALSVPKVYLYCGTPCGGGPCPGAPPFWPPCIITAGCCAPPPCICCCTSGLYLMSWPKWQMWQLTSLWGLIENGMMGTKQNVNHSQRFVT